MENHRHSPRIDLIERSYLEFYRNFYRKPLIDRSWIKIVVNSYRIDILDNLKLESFHNSKDTSSIMESFQKDMNRLILMLPSDYIVLEKFV